MHINNIATLGENKWYDGGDERFHPDNIILMREIPTYLELFQRKQEISSGGSVRISMKMRQQENLAGSLDSIIYI